MTECKIDSTEKNKNDDKHTRQQGLTVKNK